MKMKEMLKNRRGKYNKEGVSIKFLKLEKGY